ncbi:CBS domain-containing protein [Halorientalis litorea]|jgi:acyl dehydratase/CBS domain-containing protein|uniref:CBS domain-containing protein n=1 Tax=Halorientalis litorea TaxID=2931977 RepID=UPI001FF5DA06|nr:CBS domain-containing protein [Halorientalis litorea]
MLVPVTISEVMSPEVSTVGPDVSATDVATRLFEEDIGSVVVVRDGAPVGIVTESDMVRLLAQGNDAAGVTAADCMSAPPITIDRHESLELAVERLREHGIKKLPVTDGDELVGILTTTDLSYYLPHLTRRAGQQASGAERHERARVDTAYEEDDWEFESVGERADHIDVGDVVRFSKTLDGADVDAFAAASGDTNRLHLDADYAEGTRFGRRIAHGTLVAGVVSAALARLPGLIVYLSQDVSYLGPVDIGDRVTAICEVVEELGNERYRLTTAVFDGEGREVIDGEAVVIADPIPETA